MKKEVNQGIQGTNVNITAQALAVGTRAQAVSSGGGGMDSRQLAEAVQQLMSAVDQLKLRPGIHDTVKEDVTRLSEAVKEPKPNKDRIGALLTGVAAKLAAFGVVVSQTAGLIEPMKKIADMAAVSLKVFGL